MQRLRPLVGSFLLRKSEMLQRLQALPAVIWLCLLAGVVFMFGGFGFKRRLRKRRSDKDFERRYMYDLIRWNS